MDTKLRELTALSLMSLGGLCLAWVKDADYFALAFAAMAVTASVEAYLRSR
jgi:hypothetical protein